MISTRQIILSLEYYDTMQNTLNALRTLGVSDDDIVRLVNRTEDEYRNLLASINYEGLSDAQKVQFQREKRFWEITRTVRRRLEEKFGAEGRPPQYVGHGKAFLRRLAAQQR